MMHYFFFQLILTHKIYVTESKTEWGQIFFSLFSIYIFLFFNFLCHMSEFLIIQATCALVYKGYNLLFKIHIHSNIWFA